MMVVLRGSGTARRRILAILVGTIAVAVAAGGTAWAESPWSIVASPNAGSSAELVAVDSKASGDAWAVGDTFDVTTSSYRTLAERWNGSVWSVVPAVNPKANNWLTGVTSVSATNAWAVGFATNGTWATNRTVIERWNGTSWGVVPSPSPSAGQNDLWSVWAASASDVWAVGDATTGSGGQSTLIEHWDGTKWSVVPSPNATGYDNLHRVAGSSATDVWAVGTAYDGSTDKTRTLVEHWDGTKWSVVPSPSVGEDDYVRGVTARSTTDAWLVGEWDEPAPSYTPHPLVEHWNGTSWQVVTSPSNDSYTLNGIDARSATDAWIVGDRYDYATNSTRTLIEHWNGSTWSKVSSPNKATSSGALNGLYSVRILSSGLGWAVGAYEPSGGPSRTLALRTNQG